MKVVFIGTPEFAVPCLQALCRDPEFEVAAVVTRPDLPAGRQLTLQAPPIKVWAAKLKVKNIWQPQNLIQMLDNLRALQPDVIAVVSYSQLIPPEVLRLPKFGCVNVHPSLLPQFRGSTPMQAAILQNAPETGVTIMQMDETFDTGPILSQAKVKLSPAETLGSLSDKLSPLSAKLLTDTLKKYCVGQLSPQAQDNTLATYAPRLQKSDGLIDWQKPAQIIERFIRALGDWPGAWTWARGKQLKILKVAAAPLPLNSYQTGKTFSYNNQLAVQCGTDALVIEQLQLEGKSATQAKDWLNGQPDFIGAILG